MVMSAEYIGSSSVRYDSSPQSGHNLLKEQHAGYIFAIVENVFKALTTGLPSINASIYSSAVTLDDYDRQEQHCKISMCNILLSLSNVEKSHTAYINSDGKF